MQNFSSANTSINSSKLPAICSKLRSGRISKALTLTDKKLKVLDYGCGRYVDHIRKFFSDLGCEYYNFDLTWFPNFSLLTPDNHYDIVICSNVLNVINDDNTISDIVAKIADKKFADHYLVTIYSGNSSGVGKVTKYDCWQRNEPIANYLRFFPNTAKILNGVITDI